MFRIKNTKDLDLFGPQSTISPAIRRQIERALSDTSSKQHQNNAVTSRNVGTYNSSSNSGTRSLCNSGESKGEAAVRIALTAAFGQWFDGGEVLQECLPFSTRQYRTDFALPRYRIAVEVDGWQHHGKSLDDHHKDRERARFFARNGWLMFPVSHGQATKESGELVGCLADALKIVQPIPRSAIDIETIHRVAGNWHRIQANWAQISDFRLVEKAGS